MQVPSFLSPFMDGDSPTRLIQGLVVGIVGTLIIGFNWGGWNLGSTVEEKVAAASQAATVTALAPICADKFVKAAKANNGLIVELKAVKSWQRDRLLTTAGWATFPGGLEPDNNVAEACAVMLNTALKLK
jgi:ammonia channel protein AmtB